MWKILYKNILALYRYRNFHVGIFYFASPCTKTHRICYDKEKDVKTKRLLRTRAMIASVGVSVYTNFIFVDGS